MEGGAVAQVARRWGDDIALVNVRCLSDLAGTQSHLDFHAFLPVAARYASQVAHRLAPAI
jgi:adenosylhomocysteine nucleosidase